MQLCKVHVRAIKAKTHFRNQVFDRRSRNFANQSRCVLFWCAEQKASPDVMPIAASWLLQVRCSALRARASADNASLPRQASRGAVHRESQKLHVDNLDLGTVEHVNSGSFLDGNHNVLARRMEVYFSQVFHGL